MTMRVSKDRIDMDDKVLKKPVLEDYGETVVSDIAGSSYTIDLRQGNVFDLMLNRNCTFTFSNPPASGTVGSFTLILRQAGGGSRTVTWPGTVNWPGATAPTLTTTFGYYDIIQFFTYTGGSTWNAVVGAQNYASTVTTAAISFLEGDLDTTTQSEYTFSSKSLGTADTTREIFVSIVCGTGSQLSLSSGSIAGVSATIASSQHAHSSSFSALMFASVPTGTTGDIVVTPSGSCTRCSIAIYRVIDRLAFGTNQSDSSSSASGGSTSITVSGTTVYNNGFMIGNVAKGNTENPTSNVLTNDYGTADFYTHAHYPVQGSTSTPSQQWSWSTSAAVRGSTWSFD